MPSSETATAMLAYDVSRIGSVMMETEDGQIIEEARQPLTREPSQSSGWQSAARQQCAGHFLVATVMKSGSL